MDATEELKSLLEDVLEELKSARCNCKKHVVEVEVPTVADIATAEAEDNIRLAEVEEHANVLANTLSDQELATLFLCLNTEIIERGLTKMVLDMLLTKNNKGDNR